MQCFGLGQVSVVFYIMRTFLLGRRLEEFVIRFFSLPVAFILLAFSFVPAQVNTVIGQFTDSPNESFAGSASGNGRFVVFESRGNLATENPRNEDGNSEIFLFDYAQRRIFQITDTKSVLWD